MLLRASFEDLSPSQDDAIPDWWLTNRKRTRKIHRKGFDSYSFVVLVSEGTQCKGFQQLLVAAARLAGLISEIGGDWVQAGIWSLSRFV
jgi:hypothetical protein